PTSTLSDGSARYQKPVSISESGASRLGISAVAIREKSGYHRPSGTDIRVRVFVLVLGSRAPVQATAFSLGGRGRPAPHEHGNQSDKNVRPTRAAVGIILGQFGSCFSRSNLSNNETTRIFAAAFWMGNRDCSTHPAARRRCFSIPHRGSRS